MKIITRPIQFQKVSEPIVLAVGFFDGLHRGHQTVLASTMTRARDMGWQAWVLTFDRHPLAVLCPSKAPPLLCTLEERLERLEAFGLDGALVLPFTRRLATLDPETFVQWICGASAVKNDDIAKRVNSVKLREIRCGENWRFGRRALGTPDLLAQYGVQYGFQVIVVPFAEYQGLEISSTRIRYAVREGRLDDATKMLGRPYSIRDVVIRGHGLGQSLTVATANVHPRTEVLPPNGVYAIQAIVKGICYNGVANLGINPTFPEIKRDQVVLETHLFEFAGKLYGKTIEVFFRKRLRDERVFTSPEALACQIAVDIKQAKRYF